MTTNNNNQGVIGHDDFLERMRTYTAPNPSPRNPSISKDSSHADKIEAGYQADGHQTWGYVIYRTTYVDDALWTEFMRRLRACAVDEMEFYNGQDVLDKMTWTVFDDRERFDGADVATIRAEFRAWAESTHQLEQQQLADTVAEPASIGMGRSPRYRYCVQVTAESLSSVVGDSSAPLDANQTDRGWVILIDKNWLPRSQDPVWVGRPIDTQTYEPIEGVVDYNVGWVKCPFRSVLTEYYMLFMDRNGFMVNYRRPPAIIGYPWS